MKKIVSILLVASMIFVMAACTGQVAATGSASEGSAEVQTETSDQASNTTEGAVSTDPINVGMYTTLTGASANAGECQERGVRIAMDEINAAGGINGRMIELIVYDDGGTTEGAVKATTRLIEVDDVDYILGGFSSPNILASSALTEEAKVLHIGVGTASSWTSIGCEYLYRATVNGSLPIKTFIELMKEMGEKTATLISVETEYGQSGHDNIVAQLEESGIELLSDVTYQTTDTDFTGHIAKMMAKNPDTIILYGLGNEMALILKQLRQQGFTNNVYTCEGGANSDILTVAGSSANGLIFAAPYVVPATPEEGATDLIKQVLTTYYTTYGDMPASDLVYRGYDQLMLLAEALKKVADITDREAVKDAFKSLSGIELCGGSFDFNDGTGDGLKVSSAFMIYETKVQVFDMATMQSWEASQS